MQEKAKWGGYWFLGRDFNDINEDAEKRGGRRRLDSSFRSFRSFITNIDMEEIKAEVGCLQGQIIGNGRILWKKNWIDFLGQLAC